ncbi:MAG: ATPase domain-containing protein [bacterium]
MSDLANPERMPFGIEGLDHLFEGGLIRGNSLLIEGPPGSGKTTFAIRAVYEGIVRYDEPGLIITFEEFPKQIYQEALGYGVDLAALERAGKLRVVWTPPSRVLEGFSGKTDLLEKIIKDLGVRRLVIDSITHFKRVAHDEVRLRETLAEIFNWIKLKGINSFLVKELERIDDQTIAFEEYLVDASMRVYNTPAATGGENVRFVEIRKTRGQAHVSGRHPFRLASDGIRVYPTLRPHDVRTKDADGAAPRVKVAVGVPGADPMLDGGVWNGSLNLLLGPPGTGKSVFSYHFLDTGLRAGEPCLLVTLRQGPDEILESVRSLGMDWTEAVRTGQLEIFRQIPVGISLEQVLYSVHERVRDRHPGRLVIDSLDDLWGLVRDDDRIRDALLVLGEMARSHGATTFCLHEQRSRSGAAEGRSDYADLASCVIQLTLVETGGELHRFLGIRKMAGADHAKELREFSIGPKGFRVARKPTGLSGILSGDTRGNLNEVADTVIPYLDEIARHLASLDDESLPPERRDPVRAARSRLASIDVLLREHFGITNFRELAEELKAQLESSAK